MNERIFTLIKLRHSVGSVSFDKQDLPSIPEGFDDKGVLGATAFSKDLGHGPRVQERANECKR